MMRSMFSGISGLKNHQTRMDVIGNNIANVNTTGFKGSRVTFQDMLNQNISGAAGPQGLRGGVNPQQIGLGMAIANVDVNFADGSAQSTGVNTDLCINGNGFFILGNGMEKYYTRDGSFRFDEAGNYVNGAGMHVQGWMADSDGNLNTNGPTEDIVVPTGQTLPAKESTKAEGTGNLSGDAAVRKTETKTGLMTSPGAAQPVLNSETTDADGVVTEITGVTGPFEPFSYTYTGAAALDFKVGDKVYSGANGTGTVLGTVESVSADGKTITFKGTQPAGSATGYVGNIYSAGSAAVQGTLAAGDSALIAGGQVYLYDTKVTTPGARNYPEFTVYDSLGVAHKVSGQLEKVAAVPGTSTTWEFTPLQAKNKDGSLKFNPDGTPAYEDSTGAKIQIGNGAPPGKMTLVFDNQGKLDTTQGNPIDEVTLTQQGAPTSGAKEVKFSLDLSKMTGYGGDGIGTKTSIVPDGYAAGELQSVSIDPSGILVGNFSNGQKKDLARVALATFNNPAGLEKDGSNLYRESNNSGVPVTTQPGQGGTKTLTPTSLEMSNINMSEQFSDMIITQRGFQSNSKIITVSDEMLETLVNLKR